MADKRQAKKEDLKARLIGAAIDLIQEQGLKGLRARDIAEKAGAALGGLYTVFDDLDALILHVNSATLKDMEAALSARASQSSSLEESFRGLSLAYLDFALANRNRWAALFDHRMAEGVVVPDWHLAEHAFLIGLIAVPLSRHMPDASPDEIALRARTLFGAVHGVIAISLEDRFVGITSEMLRHEVAALAVILSRGLMTPTAL